MKKKQVIGAALITTMMASMIPIPSSLFVLADTQTEMEKLQPELIAWYSEPATDWENEAMPLGNGFIGAMLFGGVECDRIQVNEHTLWSGGPGANVDYNGGMSGDPQKIKEALQTVRITLQEKMTEFTNNHTAYFDKTLGKIISEDYALEDEDLQALIQQLMGEKSNFGDYQTFGNILISDLEAGVPQITEVTSNCTSFSDSEKYDKLFDGDAHTKWYSAAGAPEDYSIPSPIWIKWSYNQPITTKSYDMISGNDVPDRDPKDWRLYGSNDGKNFVLLDTRTGEAFSDRNMTRSFELEKEVSYQHFKIEILNTYKEGTPCQLSEIKLASDSFDREDSYRDYRRELNLDKGIATVSYRQNEVNYKREYFVNNPSNVIVIRLTADQNGKITKNIAITSEQTEKSITVSGNTITMTGHPADQMENGLKFAGELKVNNKGGSITQGNDSIEVRNADEIILVMSTGTNYQQCKDSSFDYFSEENPLEAVSNRVKEASDKPYQVLLDEHIRDYTSLYGRVTLNLCDVTVPDKSTDHLLAGYGGRGDNPNTLEEDRYLENLYYQFGRYLLISSSREGSLPANLQGIWAQGLSSPWNSDYHTNINLQMNYWLAEQTNLSECHLPLIDYINSLVPRGILTAGAYYCTQDGNDVRGWVTHHENNIWGNTGPGNYYYGFYFPAAAAWLCQDIWEYYLFNQDKQFLEDNYDTLLQAALFWVDNLWTDSRDGKLVANPSYSPEHGPYSLGATADQGIIWEIFDQVIKASDVLGKTSSEIEEIRDAKSKLAGPQIGLAGQFMEWKDEISIDISGDSGHRHANHLYALHPGSQIVAGRSEEEDLFIEAIKSTLNTRGDGGTGWSKAWKINFWARLRDGNRAHKLVKEILSESTLKNLFDTHPPFQIDGNFGATAGMNEMLLQSQGDSIDLLPSLPAAWDKGQFSGLKARGNFEISAVWKNNMAQSFTVTSHSGNDCVLNYYSLSKADIIRKSDGKKIDFNEINTDTISFQTETGETYVISNIPQDKVFSNPREFMKASIENLYHSSIMNKLQAPSNKGVYIDTLSESGFADIIGLKQYDLIVSINGDEVINTNDFMANYEGCKEGTPIHLKIWRENEYKDIYFIKSSYDNYLILPGLIEVEDYDELYGNGIKIESCEEGGENLGFIASGDYAVYRKIKFKEIPAKFHIRSSGTSANKVSVRLDSLEGPVIAELNVTPTKEWQTYATTTTDIINADQLVGGHDLYLILNAGMNVNWISFETSGELMPDMEEIMLRNKLLELYEEYRQLLPDDYTEESFIALQDLLKEVKDSSFGEGAKVDKLKDTMKRLEDAKSSLVPETKAVIGDVIHNKKSNTVLYIMIITSLLALGGIAIGLILRKNKK